MRLNCPKPSSIIKEVMSFKIPRNIFYGFSKGRIKFGDVKNPHTNEPMKGFPDDVPHTIFKKLPDLGNPVPLVYINSWNYLKPTEFTALLTNFLPKFAIHFFPKLSDSTVNFSPSSKFKYTFTRSTDCQTPIIPLANPIAPD